MPAAGGAFPHELAVCQLSHPALPLIPLWEPAQSSQSAVSPSNAVQDMAAACSPPPTSCLAYPSWPPALSGPVSPLNANLYNSLQGMMAGFMLFSIFIMPKLKVDPEVRPVLHSCHA